MKAVIDVAFSPLKRKGAVVASNSRNESTAGPMSVTRTQPAEPPSSPSSEARSRVLPVSWSPFGQKSSAPPSPQYQSESSTSRSDAMPKRLFGRSGGSAGGGDGLAPNTARKQQHLRREQGPESLSQATKNSFLEPHRAVMLVGPGSHLRGHHAERLGKHRVEGTSAEHESECQSSGSRREARRMSVGPGCVSPTPHPRRLSTGSGTISNPDYAFDSKVRLIGAPQHRHTRRMSTGARPVDKHAGLDPNRRQRSDGATTLKEAENESPTFRQQRRMSTGTSPLNRNSQSSPQRRMSAGGFLPSTKYYHMDSTPERRSYPLVPPERSPCAEGSKTDNSRSKRIQQRRGSTGHAANSSTISPRRMSTGSSAMIASSASRSHASDDSYYQHPFYREPKHADRTGLSADEKSRRWTSETVNTPNHDQTSRLTMPKVPYVQSFGSRRGISKHEESHGADEEVSDDNPVYQSHSNVSSDSPHHQSCDPFQKNSFEGIHESPKYRLRSPRIVARVSPRSSPRSQSNTSQSFDSIDSHDIIRGVPRSPLDSSTKVSLGSSRDVSHHRMERRYSNDYDPGHDSRNREPIASFAYGCSRHRPRDKRASVESDRAERRSSNDFRPSPPVRTRTLQSTDSCIEILDQTERFSVENAASEDDDIIVTEEDYLDEDDCHLDGSLTDEIVEFHHETMIVPPSGAKPTKLYDHARRCQWENVLEECSRNHRDASYVCPKDGTTALHLAVMSRCNPLLRNGDLKGYKPAPRLVVEALLVACPEAAITRCSVKKYTPLTYACLVTDETFDMSDAADMVVTILRHAPQSAYVFTDDGFSALDIHIMSYSRLHGHKEEVYSGGRTSTVVLRTLLEEKPVLADARTYRNKIRGPLELLYRCNMEEFKDAVEGGSQRSKPKHLTSVVSTLDDWWAWKWAQLLMKYASLSSEEVKTKQPFRAVQAASRLVGCPIPVLSLAIALFPQQLQSRDPRGELYNMPLHEVASWRCDTEIICGDPFVIRRKARAIKLLLDEYPAAARTTNNMGETPLQLAIESGTPWHGGLEILVVACPKALKFPRKLRSRTDENKTLISVSLHSDIESVDSSDEDPEVALEGMYPFMVAAVVGRVPQNLQRDPSFLFEGQSTKEHEQNLRKKDLESVRSIFGLLRARPDALASYISDVRKGKQPNKPGRAQRR